MAPRKNKPLVNAAPDNDRFRPDDIVRAIEAVERSGLIVRGVEIAKSGSIKIETAPRDKVAQAQPSTKLAEPAPTAKKQA
jgi:hypothetical protein